MYCSKCGKQMKDDSMFCSFCGTKIPEIVLKNRPKKDDINNDEIIISKNQKNNENVIFQKNLGVEDIEIVTDSTELNGKTNLNSKNNIKKKTKLKIIIFTILFVTIVGIIIGNIGYKVYKNSIENFVPNYYISIGGSRGTSTNLTTGEKKYEVSVTSKIELYELSIDVYVYDFLGEFIDTFNYTQKIDLDRSTKKVEIKFENPVYMERYKLTFYATGKTHEKLPDLDYASIYFMNYDDTVYETMYVEKDYGDIWKLPVTPTRTGYIFDGWYYDKNYSKKFDITEQYWRDKGQNLKLYPKWIES